MSEFYVNYEKKFGILTANRTGSSIMNQIAGSNNNLEPAKSSISNLSELQNQGINLYMTIKEPAERRRSALDMICNLHDEPMYNVMFLKGMIHSSLQNSQSTILPDYIFSNSHMDWGNSVYYHVLKLKGIHVNPLLLTNPEKIWNDHPHPDFNMLYVEYVNRNQIPTYTSFLKHYCLETEEAREVLEGWLNSVGPRTYGPQINYAGGSKRSLLYETWLMEFRKFNASQTNMPILSIDEFEWFDQRCHLSILREHTNKNSHESSDDLLRWLKDKFLNHPNISQLEIDPVYSMSCVNYLKMFDVFTDIVYNQ